MARYRPPAPKVSAYITPGGYRALQTESKALWGRRTDVAKALATAAAEGDRSENAEYIYRKKELREIDRRIRYLQKRLPDLKIVSTPPEDRSRVFFGARVTLENLDGGVEIYRIVGPDEIDPTSGHISMDSPMARALMKKSRKEDVRVETPVGLKDYVLVDLEYPGE